MALLRKTEGSGWQPSEKPDMQAGDTLEVTNYEYLVKSGQAVLIDEFGNELELPNQKITCPICFTVLTGLVAFHEHVGEHLKKKPTSVIVEAVKVEPTITPAEQLQKDVDAELEKQQREDLTRAKRRAALEKARAARARNRGK